MDAAGLLRAEKKLPPPLAKVGGGGQGALGWPRAAQRRTRHPLSAVSLFLSRQVLVYELLFGHGLRGGGRAKALVLKHRARLVAELARLKVRRKVSRNEDLLPQADPGVCPSGE